MKVPRTGKSQSKRVSQWRILRHLTLTGEHGEEFQNQFSIPQTIMSFVLHSDCRLFVSQSRFIWTRGAERVLNVHHLQNSGQKRNVAPKQPIRISAAIEVLMMVADDRQHEAQRLQWPAN